LGNISVESKSKEEAKVRRVYRLVILEIVNFDEIETLDEAKYDLVGVVEAPSSDECFEKANAAFDDDRFVWWSHDF
jgi:hypothetical protein